MTTERKAEIVRLLHDRVELELECESDDYDIVRDDSMRCLLEWAGVSVFHVNHETQSSSGVSLVAVPFADRRAVRLARMLLDQALRDVALSHEGEPRGLLNYSQATLLRQALDLEPLTPEGRERWKRIAAGALEEELLIEARRGRPR